MEDQVARGRVALRRLGYARLLVHNRPDDGRIAVAIDLGGEPAQRVEVEYRAILLCQGIGAPVQGETRQYSSLGRENAARLGERHGRSVACIDGHDRTVDRQVRVVGAAPTVSKWAFLTRSWG